MERGFRILVVSEILDFLGMDIKRSLEIPFYNLPGAPHLKIIFHAFKKIAKYFGNKSEFFLFWRQCHKCLGDNTIKYNS